VDETTVNGVHDAWAVGFAQRAGNLDFDMEIVEAGGWTGFLRGSADRNSLAIEALLVEIGNGVEGGAGGEGREKELGRSHPVVGTAVAGRLIADEGVPAGGDFELHGAVVLYVDFNEVGRSQLACSRGMLMAPGRWPEANSMAERTSMS